MVGEGGVITPHVELPLLQAEDAAVDAARVDADPHVELRYACHLTYQPGGGGGGVKVVN